MKRILSLALIVAVAFSAIGLASHPAAAQSSSSPAMLMPADTAVYAEVNTGKLTDSINMIVGILNKAGLPVTADQAFNHIDQGLTQALQHKVSFQTDIQPWLGDRAAFGIEINDAMIQNPSAKTQPPVLAIVNVKDDAAADKFLTDTLNSIQQKGVSFTKTTDQVNGQTATLYANEFFKVTLAHLPGELALGTTAAINNMLDVVKNNKPTLGADAKFQKTMALLKPDSNFTLFVSPSALKLAAAGYINAMRSFNFGSLTGTPMPTPPALSNLMQQLNVLDVYNGIVLGLRASGKTFAFDLGESYDPAKLSTFASQYGFSAADMTLQPLSGKLAAQIPSKAVGVLIGSNLGHFYQLFRKELNAFSAMPTMSARQKQQFDQIQRGLAQFEQALKSNFNLDIDQDVLSWLGGDFGLYSVLNPNGDMATLSHGQFPFDTVLIVSASDSAKAQSFVDKLNAGLPKLGITPATAGTGLYTLPVGKQVKLGYGVSNGAFLLTTSGTLNLASAATAGTDSLSSGSTPWKNATANLPSNVTELGFLDLSQIGSYIQGITAAHASNTSNADQGTRMGLALFNEFESALFYSTAPDTGSAVASFQLNLK
ncbi:MAG: DUF3352 domain-containing protein [Aggregatilineales bacterium]